MSLAPLLNASLAIQLHAFAATGAFALGLVQLASPKETIPHRTLDWIWVVLMLIVAISAFWIHERQLRGPYSPIHLLSVVTLVMLPLGILYARRHKVLGRRLTMIGLFAGALLIAGAFTFWPGRIMHSVAFGA